MTLKRAAGTRQRIWDTLRRARSPLSVTEIAKRAECNEDTLRVYLSALRRHEYIEIADHQYTITKRPGPICPSSNAAKNEFRDWNLEPPMDPEDLRQIWALSGLTMRQFALALGMGEGTGTRLRQMIEGQRMISDSIRERALEFQRQAQP
jgi:hypothetical protein